MPQERSDMRRVKEVLRLAHELGYSTGKFRSWSGWAGRRWANIWRGPRGRRALRRCCRDGQAEVEALLFKRPEPAVRCHMPDWQRSRRSGKPAVTSQLVWQEYRDRHADGHSYSQFRRRYRSICTCGA